MFHQRLLIIAVVSYIADNNSWFQAIKERKIELIKIFKNKKIININGEVI